MELSLPLWWLLAKCLMAAFKTSFGKGVLFNQGKPTSTGAGFWFQQRRVKTPKGWVTSQCQNSCLTLKDPQSRKTEEWDPNTSTTGTACSPCPRLKSAQTQRRAACHTTPTPYEELRRLWTLVSAGAREPILVGTKGWLVQYSTLLTVHWPWVAHCAMCKNGLPFTYLDSTKH